MSKDEGEFVSGAVPDEPIWSKASNLGRLEQRVTNIEGSLKDIKEGSLKDIKEDFRSFRDQITEIHRAILTVGKPQYAVISGFAGVMLLATAGLWGLVIKPVNDDLSRLYGVTDKLSIRLEDDLKLLDAKKLDRAACDETRSELNARISELNARLKRQ